MKLLQTTALLGAAFLAGCAPFEHGHYAEDVGYENVAGDPPGTPLLFDRFASRRPGAGYDSYAYDDGYPYSAPASYTDVDGCGYDPCAPTTEYVEPIATYAPTAAYSEPLQYSSGYVSSAPAVVDPTYANLQPAAYTEPVHHDDGYYTGETLTHEHGSHRGHAGHVHDDNNYVSVDSGYTAPLTTSLPVARPNYISDAVPASLGHYEPAQLVHSESAPIVHHAQPASVIHHSQPGPIQSYVQEQPAPVVAATTSSAPIQAPPVHLQGPTIQVQAPPVYAPGFPVQGGYPPVPANLGGYPPLPGYGQMAPIYGGPVYGQQQAYAAPPMYGGGLPPVPANLGGYGYGYGGGSNNCYTVCGPTTY